MSILSMTFDSNREKFPEELRKEIEQELNEAWELTYKAEQGFEYADKLIEDHLKANHPELLKEPGSDLIHDAGTIDLKGAVVSAKLDDVAKRVQERWDELGAKPTPIYHAPEMVITKEMREALLKGGFVPMPEGQATIRILPEEPYKPEPGDMVRVVDKKTTAMNIRNNELQELAGLGLTVHEVFDNGVIWAKIIDDKIGLHIGVHLTPGNYEPIMQVKDLTGRKE
jgi:hypothetical protein